MTTVQQLADHEAIRGLLARLGSWLDGHGGDPADIYEPDVTARGPRGTIQGLAQVIERVGPRDDERSQHLHTDVVVDVDGDRAIARASQLLHGFRPGQPPHRSAGVRAEYHLARGEKGWRIAQLEITLEWIVGDLPT